MIFSSAPPTAALVFVGEIETSRLKFSSEINNFDRDSKFRSRSIFFDPWALWVEIPENSQQLLPVLVLKFGDVSALQCCTGDFKARSLQPQSHWWTATVSLPMVRGQILYTPPPPHPWKYPSRGGGCIKEGGRIKSCRGGLQNTPPPPLSEKGLLAEMGGEGGGAYKISPWIWYYYSRGP